MRRSNTTRSPGFVSSAAAGMSFPCHAERLLGRKLLHARHHVIERAGERIAACVTAGNDPEASGVPRHLVEVEGDLHSEVRGGVAEIGVPSGVAHVEVPVAVAVVEVVPQDIARQSLDSRVVEQGAEVRVLVDERDDGRAPLVVVRLTVMPSATLGEDRLEGIRDPSNVVGEQPREVEVSEGLEERDLLVGQFQLRVLSCGIR